MKLDSRIKKLSDILTCFDIEKAKEFVGQKGYFENDLYCFSDVETCFYNTLAEVKDGDTPFKDDDCCYWNLFIPESVFLKSKKKYRALTIDEFLDRFDIGEVIVFRSKAMPDYVLHVLFDGYVENGKDNEVSIILGHHRYSLQELFTSYEYDDGDNWLSFGVEE